MYRYIKSSNILNIIEDFDLEDFGEYVVNRLKRKFNFDIIKMRKVYLTTTDNVEVLNVDIIIDGSIYSVSYLLDRRRIKNPRDLIAKYAEPVISEFIDQLNADGIFGASYSMEQEFSSKQTASGNGSFNKGKGRVPALFKKIQWAPGTVNFDYGCGYKSTQDRITEFLAEKGVDYIGFDKFNQTPQEQNAAWAAIEENGGADTATCANVLNVVKERDVRVNEIIANIYDVLKPGGVAYFDVYEGDKSSTGGQTGKDNYQLKRPVDGYLEEIEEVFGEGNVALRGKLIKARK